MSARSTARGRRWRVAGLGLIVSAIALALVPPAPSAQAGPAVLDSRGVPSARVATAAGTLADGGYESTRTVGREVLAADGSVDPSLSSSYDMTVKADRTRDLRGRERVDVTWSGARPSAARASNPFGEKGLLQEYPVVVLQCRGVDSATAPADQRLRPQTCWTSSVAQRSQISRSSGEATWTVDRYADPADRQRISGADPFPSQQCPGADSSISTTHLTEFVTAKGKTFPACSSSTMPPEAAVDAAFPPAEIAAFTDESGKGKVQFEVRSDVENESLGCNDKVDCAIVVVPILGISCDRPSTPMTSADRACRRGGRFEPGSSNFADDGVDSAVAPTLWWSESNWRNRFTVPLTFGLPASVCDVLDTRAPVNFFGSELMAQAALQWAPAYCLRKDRFNFQLSQMPDEAGFTNMRNGNGPAAFVSSSRDTPADEPVGYAPTAVTGFEVGYTIDRPGNAGEYDRLRMNPRLIAKLLSQSYLGSDLGRKHPGIEANPLAIMDDPEFIGLNPGLSRTVQEAGATLLSLSVSSDIVRQLSGYLDQDADARAFLDGTPDPWGMKVNPAYQGIELPVQEWPLLDTYIPTTNNECLKQNPSVYFSQLASPVSTLRTIADVLIDAWPNVQTRCDFDTATQTYKLGRRDRQSYGARFVLGLVSLGDADRFGLRAAELETRKGTFVAPSDASMGAAVKLMKQTSPGGTFDATPSELVAAGDAYPGTMVVYTAAKASGLAADQASTVSSFIKVATSEGQSRGRGNGELPAGYLPIARTGATADLWTSAQDVAGYISAQKGLPAVVTPEDGVSDGAPGGGDGAADAAGPGGGAAATGLPGVSADPAGVAPGAGAAAGAGATDAELVATAATIAPGSTLGGVLLPGLLLLGVLATASAVVSRLVGSKGTTP